MSTLTPGSAAKASSSLKACKNQNGALAHHHAVYGGEKTVGVVKRQRMQQTIGWLKFRTVASARALSARLP